MPLLHHPGLFSSPIAVPNFTAEHVKKAESRIDKGRENLLEFGLCLYLYLYLPFSPPIWGG